MARNSRSLPVLLLRLAALTLLLGLASAPRSLQATNHIVYVNDNASGDDNGSSWANALTKLQDALIFAEPGNEIWVAAGVYYPDEGFLVADNDAANAFTLMSGVAVYGGFAGTETALSQRNIATNVTVLSGDIRQNDTTDANKIVTDKVNIVGPNATHVVIANGVDATARLDGFVVTAGTATMDNVNCPGGCGGGLHANAGSPTLANLRFIGNVAYYGAGFMFYGTSTPALSDISISNNSSYDDGGGLQAQDGAVPTLTRVEFSANIAADFGGGAYFNGISPTLNDVTFSDNSAGNHVNETGGGGGMAGNTSSPSLTNVTFSGNFAPSGGAMYNLGGSPQLRNVTFSGNYATTDENGGGGMYNTDSNPYLVNVIFRGNRADDGGAIYNVHSNPVLVNALFSGNYAQHGGAIYAGGTTTLIIWNATFSGNYADSVSSIYGGGSSNVQLYNVITWGNSALDNVHLNVTSNNLTLQYNLIENLNPGTTNLDGTNPANNPRFVSAVNCGADNCSDDPTTPGTDESANDFYGDLRLQGGSPAVDAGDNNLVAADTLDLDEDSNVAEPLPLDLAGEPRFAAITSATPIVDMGAYERVNGAPIANLGGPYATIESGSISLNGSASTDDGAVAMYEWDCTNDGSIDASSATPTGDECTYPDDGSYTLRLTITDNLDATGTATIAVAVTNVAPTYTPAPNQSTTAGNAKSFAIGSFIDPGVEASWEITVDWGDDSTPSELTVNGTGALPNTAHTYANAGTYNVAVTVNDGDASNAGGFQVVVNPAPPGVPVVTGPDNQSVMVDEEKSFTLGSFTDPGSNNWQITVDWGDDSTPTQFSINSSGDLPARPHQYTDAGIYDVIVTVNDGGLAASASFQVTVDAAPTSDAALFIPTLSK